MTNTGKLKVKLVASPIGQTDRQRRTLRGLGLKRIGTTVLVEDSPCTRGMIGKLRHLVRVEA